MSDDDVPEVPEVPPVPETVLNPPPGVSFVTIDAAMLAAQTRHLERLNKTIQDLAQAVRERPTKREIQRARRRTLAFTVFVIVVSAFLFGWLFLQQQKLHDQCVDRNNNAAQFRVLLEKLLAQPEAPGTPPPTQQQKELEQAFIDYKNSLTPIDC